MMPLLIGITAAQDMPILNDPDASLRKLVDVSESIVESLPWADVICFLELFVTGLHQFTKSTLMGGKSFVQSVNGLLTREFRQLANRLGKWLISGSYYEREGENINNTSVVISPEGVLIAHYRKLYPWQLLEKTTLGNPGLCVFDIPQMGRLGLYI